MASSTESGPQKIKSFKDLLKNFAEVLSEHQELANNSKFIFVPGPNDPGYANIYPRPPLPEFISQELTAKIPNCKYHYINWQCITGLDILVEVHRNFKSADL